MKKGYLYIVLAAFLYSTQEIAGRFLAVNGKMDPVQVTFLIFTIGTIIQAPLAFREMRRRKLKFTPKDFPYLALVGILAVPIAMLCLQFTVTYTVASTSAVIFCSNAVLTIPFAMLILHARIKRTDVAAMVICSIGVIVIFNPVSIIGGMTGSRNLVGILYALVAAVAWSLFGVISKKKMHRYGPYVTNFFGFLAGILVLFVMLLVTGRPILTGIHSVSSVLVLLYMGVFIKALGYIFYLGSIHLTSPVTASLVFLVKPALATLLAVLLLHEVLAANNIAGIILVVIGSCVSFCSNRRAERRATGNPHPLESKI